MTVMGKYIDVKRHGWMMFFWGMTFGLGISLMVYGLFSELK